MKTLLIKFTTILLIFIATILTPAQERVFRVSSVDEIKADLVTIPCEDKKRLEAVKSLFERAGATPSEVTIEKHDDVRNLVWTKKGQSSEKIIIGAHYGATFYTPRMINHQR